MNLKIELIGGNCPVQAEGTINGKPFYFRARGEGWSMSIGDAPLELPRAPGFDANGNIVRQKPVEWYAWSTWGVWPEAGWMPEEEARRLIEWCATEYQAHLARVASEAPRLGRGM